MRRVTIEVLITRPGWFGWVTTEVFNGKIAVPTEQAGLPTNEEVLTELRNQGVEVQEKDGKVFREVS